MREVPHVHVWDFCLRALWREEPVYVTAPLYRYRVLSSTEPAPVAKSEVEAAQLMRCLKPGGIAVHMTEFNLSSNFTTVETPDLVIFRRCDMDELIRRLEHIGYAVAPLNLNPGSDPVDRYVNVPPYRPEPHLRVRLHRYATTSIGLIIRKQS